MIIEPNWTQVQLHGSITTIGYGPGPKSESLASVISEMFTPTGTLRRVGLRILLNPRLSTVVPLATIARERGADAPPPQCPQDCRKWAYDELL